MANLPTQQNRASPKKQSSRQNRKTTKIDMTAMVDVAFLLLAFFVLSATINHAKYMDISYPPPCPDGQDCTVEMNENRILTLVLDSANVVTYYSGEEIEKTDFSEDGIRPVLQAHLRKFSPVCTDEVNKDCWDPIFVVKASPDSHYKNLVDILDELAIVGAPKYTIADFTLEDRRIMEKKMLTDGS